MANKLYVAEFAKGMSGIGTTWAPFPPWPPIASQIVTIAGAKSAAFNAKTQCILIVADTTCVIKVSADGALPDNTKDLLLAANLLPFPLGVNSGWYIAAGAP